MEVERINSEPYRQRVGVPGPGLKRHFRVPRDLRAKSTATERMLWDALRARHLEGLKFRRQHPVGPFVVDFYCAERRLVVEIDGQVHAAQAQADAERQAALEELDLHVCRINAQLVERDLSAALSLIRETISNLPTQAPLSQHGRGAGGEGAGGEASPRPDTQPPTTAPQHNLPTQAPLAQHGRGAGGEGAGGEGAGGSRAKNEALT
ncbi:MAG: endonuclease domain-containing protein [Chloroflexi bacterium]|nr:endonuclease domain-containing protein [Chloroflexota bacterium]